MTIAVDQARSQSHAPIPAPRFDPRNQAVALLALLRASATGGEVEASVTTLAERLKVSDRTIQRAVGRLVDAGVLEVARPPGRGWRGVPNVYRLRPCPRCADTPPDCGLCHRVRGIGNAAASSEDQT